MTRKSLYVKGVIALLLFFIMSSTMSYYRPQIGASFTIQQLEDSYSSSVGLKFWQEIKSNWLIIYIGIVVALFLNNIITLFKK